MMDRVKGTAVWPSSCRTKGSKLIQSSVDGHTPIARLSKSVVVSGLHLYSRRQYESLLHPGRQLPYIFKDNPVELNRAGKRPRSLRGSLAHYTSSILLSLLRSDLRTSTPIVLAFLHSALPALYLEQILRYSHHADSHPQLCSQHFPDRFVLLQALRIAQSSRINTRYGRSVDDLMTEPEKKILINTLLSTLRGEKYRDIPSSLELQPAFRSEYMVYLPPVRSAKTRT